VGKFYLRKNALFAAINRFKKALVLYPESGIEDKLIYNLYMTYKTLKDEDHAEEYRSLLLERYPNSEYIPLLPEPDTDRVFTGSRSAPAMAPGQASEREDLPIGLSGTYQGKDRNSWKRRLLFLGAIEPGTRLEPDLAEVPEEEKRLLQGRSLLEKVRPW
jgi:tetratricopeptide (TPR) repeat protein